MLKRHDTKPNFLVGVEDCDGPLNLEGLILEANMWSVSRLRSDLSATDTSFRVADNIGFNQLMIGDIIIMDRPRSPEHMLITGFDEDIKYVQVQRGYNGTNPDIWRKGTKLRCFRILNAPAVTQMVVDDVTDVDGTVTPNVIQASYLVYEWQPTDTCLPGRYYMEFKLIKMQDPQYFLPGGFWMDVTHPGTDGFQHTGTQETDASVVLSFNPVTGYYDLPVNIRWTGPTHVWLDNQTYTGTAHQDGSVLLDQTGIAGPEGNGYDQTGLVVQAQSVVWPSIPSFISETPSNLNCQLGPGVEWVRRFPADNREGFCVEITDSPTDDY